LLGFTSDIDATTTSYGRSDFRQAAHILELSLKSHIKKSHSPQGNLSKTLPLSTSLHSWFITMPPSAIGIAPSVSDSFSWKSQVKTLETTIPKQSPNSESRAPLTIDELVRQRSEEIPREPIISYPSSGLEYVDYTSRQIDIFAHRVAQKYKILMPQRQFSSDSEVVVGLLGPSNFEYFISILALTKLGHTVLFLSTRISIAAYTSLLETTGAKYLLADS